MLTPKKSLGQNFLIDRNIIKKIANLTNIKNQRILEIGPGTGNLTEEIANRKPKKMIVIEKDEILSNKIKSKFIKNKNIVVKCVDALLYNFEKDDMNIIISNLPYNISINLIYKILLSNKHFSKLILMVQKEVAYKMSNKSKKNNKLKFFIESTCSFEYAFTIPRHVFYPKPKIESSLIILRPYQNNKINKNKLLLFSKEIFTNKRKKISNVIKYKYSDKISKELIVKRIENLSTKEILHLFNHS